MTKNTFILLLILGSLFFHSCVDRIQLPTKEKLTLVLESELTYGNKIASARLQISSDQRGIVPVQIPENATIEISNGTEVPTRLYYNDESELYEGTLSWNNVNNLSLIAKIPDSFTEDISASAEILQQGSITNIEFIAESIVDKKGKQYIQKEIEVIIPKNTIHPLYFKLELTEKFTSEVQDPNTGEMSYQQSGSFWNVKVEKITDGGSGTGMEIINDGHGVVIDQKRLTNSSFRILVSSPFPINADNQIFKLLNTKLSTIDQDYYYYLRAKSNSRNTSTSLTTNSDPVIWPTNVVNGFGLFTIITTNNQQFEIN